ncbi:hypothetical protein JKF63_03938 [Porcisia hertigi]|uniref:Uncharacterized protein n=1 Tax=Porcisia hertigi TaxID=2761500 RepID=A0A836I3R0_9TRYP|nr:hypothetical protein JKF63_03938 [Porcisia hertigi]
MQQKETYFRRGRGGRAPGRGGDRPFFRRPPAASQYKSGGNRGGVEEERNADFKKDAASVVVSNAFQFDCAHPERCHETGRLFCLPSPVGSLERNFVVVERNITGIDDIIYSQHRDVWEHVPRGNARVYLKVDSPNGGDSYSLVGAVNGLRKFGLDDSTYGYPDAVQTVIAMEKEGGECGHLSAFVLPHPKGEGGKDGAYLDSAGDATGDDDTSRRFWVIGCKDVHIVLDYVISEECLHYYTTLSNRYSRAIKIARLWKAMLSVGDTPTAGDAPATPSAWPAASRTLTTAQAHAFHDSLHQHMWTSCFQAIFSDEEHLTDYSGVNELYFYALTLNRRAFEATPTSTSSVPSTDKEGHGSLPRNTPDTPADEPQYSRQDGLCVPVADAAALFASVGLGSHTHHYAPVVYNSPEYVQLIDTIRRRMNSAGCVLYGADGSGKVVRLWKEKSYPYQMERAARDAITNRKLTGSALQARIRRKLDQQPAELRDYFKDWEMSRMPWLLHFAAWLQATRRLTPHSQRSELHQLRSQWFSLQKEFQACVDSDPKLCDAYGKSQPESVQSDNDAQDLDVIKFVGPQGCGKSTLSCALYALLQKAQYRPCWVNQDESGDRKKFLAALQRATLPTSGVTHLIIDKINLDAKMNSDYDNLPITLTITWSHPDGESALFGVCIDRVLGRGTGHRTIRIDRDLTPEAYRAQVQKTRSFVRRAVQTCETPKDPPDVILRLDVTMPLKEMVRMIWEKLQENGTHTLLPITDSDIGEALTVAHRYQSFLKDIPRFPTYAALTIQDRQDVSKLLSLVPPEFTAGQIVQQEFHVTLKFFGGEVDPVMFVWVAERLGQSVTLTLESVVADPDGVAITVRRDDAHYRSANPIPHITISNRKGVPAKYSNDLISPTCYPGDPAKRRFSQLPPNCTVTGTFVFR